VEGGPRSWDAGGCEGGGGEERRWVVERRRGAGDANRGVRGRHRHRLDEVWMEEDVRDRRARMSWGEGGFILAAWKVWGGE
jgi:hypothetical protein